MKQLLKFSTPSCTWCKVVAPHVEEYAKENGFEVIEVDADANQDKAKEYGVMGVPVVVLLDSTGNDTKLTGFNEIMAHIKG